MSFKSKAKKVGMFFLKYVGPQIIYFGIDKIATGASARAMKGVVDAVAGKPSTKPQPKLLQQVHADLDELLNQKAKLVLDREREAIREEVRRELDSRGRK